MQAWLCFRSGCTMRMKERNREYMNKYRYAEHVKKMQKDKALCEICWEKPACILHHKDEDHNNAKRSNLIPMCRNCHLATPHESDEHLREEEEVGLKALNKPEKLVTRLSIAQDTPHKTVTLDFPRFKKGFLTIIVNGSYRLQHLIESWGYERI